jgi:hypothetical protein
MEHTKRTRAEQHQHTRSSPSGASVSLATPGDDHQGQAYIHQLEQQLRAAQQEQNVVESLLSETQASAGGSTDQCVTHTGNS